MLSALSGCNSDVFIKSIRPSESNIKLDGNGDSATIHFASSDWKILSVRCSLPQAHFRIYNAEGVDLGSMTAPSLDGLGKLALNEEQIVLAIERKHPKELTVKVDESTMDRRFELSISIGNQYESKVIHVDISPCDRYVLDSISYSLHAYSHIGNESKKGEPIVVKNEASIPATAYLHFFSNEYREVEFISDSPQAFSLLGNSHPVVDIPTMVGESLVMDGARASYSPVKQKLPLAFADKEKKISIPAHITQRITPVLIYDRFETDFTIRAHHPRTNKQRTIIGKLRSKMPTGEAYIMRESIKE